MIGTKRVLALVVSLAVAAISFQLVSADRLVGSSYIIDASVSNATAGTIGTSSSYKLVGSTGETAIGNGAGGSYMMGMGFVSQLAKSLSLTIQPSGLVAQYNLDEPSGTIISDQSIYAAQGTAVGGPTTTAGKVGSALYFNGSSQAVSIPSNSQTQLPSKGLIEAWVKSTSTTGNMAAISKSSNFWLGLSNGKASLYDWGSGTFCTDTAVIADGSWHHIAVVLSSPGVPATEVYVDGLQKITCTWTPASLTGYVAIGAFQTGASTYQDYFNGSIDHVKIFKAVVADHVFGEYSGQNQGVDSGLSFGTIMPGSSSNLQSDIIIQTDANGYTLAINQDHDLAHGADTIPAISGTIAAPVAWTEGTTEGLGFTLSATNATAIPGVWGAGNNYSRFPGTATTFYTRSGQQTSADYLTIGVRVRVSSAQVAYDTPYTNTITVTGTVTP